ncbi:hypothetical protein [Gulosibacter chungangensis]|uniref:Uncharacterized protein n=1 Tax=Gulosibacter chungangensis TaxID=979746 RepID=A0A7J5BB19_9MICO|nr:hypothetical protein [Gulosibacter chungangensis]KAB1643271.1 hypothetical protein F8O05_08640 [Gulosibacter chungangensis]
MATPRWQQLLAHPEQVDPSGVDIAVIADAGDAGYRATLGSWNKLRFGTDRDAHAAIAYILAEAFEDGRGLEEIASSWQETFPEEIAWRALIGQPSKILTSVFGPKAVAELRSWLESNGSGALPKDAARAARLLRADDRGAVYLELRRMLVNSAEPEELDAAERIADDLLVAAASGTPDRAEVRRTVLAYWGEEPPLDDVPTAEPDPGESPASWEATCELIARSTQPAFADRVIEIVFADDESWNGPGSDAEALVHALGDSAGATADAKLLDIAKAQVPMSGLAVRTLASRRRRLAGAEPELLARLNAIIVGMRDQGILEATPGPKTRLALARDRSADEDPQKVAMTVASALGRSTGDELAPEWASFAAWLAGADLPGPTPVPAASARRRGDDRGRGRLFGRR